MIGWLKNVILSISGTLVPSAKEAEHSLRAHLCWRNLARAHAFQENKHAVNIERSFYLLNTRTICAIFL